jgi:hypothetical protein
MSEEEGGSREGQGGGRKGAGRGQGGGREGARSRAGRGREGKEGGERTSFKEVSFSSVSLEARERFEWFSCLTKVSHKKK